MRRTVVRALPTLLLAAVYFLIGLAMVYGTGMIYGDALSRISDARVAVAGRDPHLGALGSIFGPLPSLLALPLILLRPLWPDLVTRGLAAIVVSSLAMAAAAGQLIGIATDRGWHRRDARIAAALFAAHPFIVLYAANGMGEALFLAFAFRLVRMLLRWNHAGDTSALVSAAGALGLMYLVRYEAAVVGAAAIAVVAARTWQTNRSSPRRSRVEHVAMACAVVSFPLAAAGIGWAIYSWILTGELFAQLTSLYGNRAILVLEGARAAGLGTGIAASFALAPGLAVLLPVAALLGLRRRDPDVFVATAVLGPALLFSVVSIAVGATFPFMRFTMVAVALVVVAAVCLRRRVRDADVWHDRLPVGARRGWRAAGTLAVVASLASAFPSSLAAMSDPQLGTQDRAVTAAFLGIAGPRDRQTLRTFSTERAIAAFLDAELAHTDRILMDTMHGFAIVAASNFPERFIVPSDRLFQRALDDPRSHGVTHLLAVPREGRGLADALNRRFATLYETGADVGLLMMEVHNDGDQPDWRVFLVDQREAVNP